MLLLNYIAASIVWIILMFLRLAMIVVGFPITLIALHFRYIDYTERHGSWAAWQFIRLPKWAWLWDNMRDGCMGDVRGKYRHEQSPKWLRGSDYWLAFNWLAVRNPCNNFSRFTPIISVNMLTAHCVTLQGQDYVRDKAGEEGFRFVRAIGRWNIPYWGLYWVSKYQIGNRNLVIRIGHKMDVDDNDERQFILDPQKAWKGMTFRFGFQKM